MLDLSPLWISLRIAAIATPVAVALGAGAAYFMQHYRGRGKALLESILLAPMVLPPTVLGFLLLLLLGKHGPLGALLNRAGISLVFTWYAAIVTATIVALPLAYKTILSAFRQIDGNLQQAARTLGASELRLFWQVTLPLALPGIVAGTTLGFARALGEFGATLMLAGNIPGKTQTLAMAIFFAVEAGAFREAALWTGTILAIALGGLILANCWQSPAKPTVKKKQAKAQPGYLAIPPTVSSRPTVARPHLRVSIRKALPGFTLDVSFETDERPLGLLGASGAGKSLILRCIAGTETPDAGRIVLNGRVLFDSKAGIDLPSRDRRVGVLFQNYALFPHLSAAENVAFGLPPSRLSVRQKGQIAERGLATMQLQGLGDRLPAELSGGQQQRVALARALASQPEILLLDEPFSALDTHLRSHIERDLRLHLEQFPGVTLLVTHNIEEAYRVCDRLLVMDRGQASVCDAKSTVMKYPKTVGAARLTGCKNISRIVPESSHIARALDWNCTLQIAAAISAGTTHLGMRAHQIEFLEALPPARTDCFGPPAESTLQDHIDGDDLQLSAKPHTATLQASRGLATDNTFPCWLAMKSETPHRVTLYLKLGEPPLGPDDYHLQAEVFREKWEILAGMPFPWSIRLDPQRLLALSQ